MLICRIVIAAAQSAVLPTIRRRERGGVMAKGWAQIDGAAARFGVLSGKLINLQKNIGTGSTVTVSIFKLCVAIRVLHYHDSYCPDSELSRHT